MARTFKLVEVPNWNATAAKVQTFELTLRDAKGWDGLVTVTRGWLQRYRPMVDGFITFPGKAAVGSLASYSPIEPLQLADWKESEGAMPAAEAQDSSYRAETDPKQAETAGMDVFEAAIAKHQQAQEDAIIEQIIAENTDPGARLDALLTEKNRREQIEAPTPETIAADIANHGQVIDMVHFDGDKMVRERIDPAEFLAPAPELLEVGKLDGTIDAAPGTFQAPEPAETLVDVAKRQTQEYIYPASLLEAPLSQEERKIVKDLRTALQQSLKDAEQLRTLAQTDGQLISALKQDHAIMRGERDRADRLVVEARAERDTAEQLKEAALASQKEAIRLLDDVRHEFQTGQTQYDQLKAALAAEQEAHTLRQIENQDLAGRRHDLIVERDELQAKYNELEGNLIEAKGDIILQADTIATLQAQLAENKDESDERGIDIDTLARNKADLEAKVERLQGELKAANERADYRMEINGALINTGIRLEQECGELKEQLQAANDQVTVHAVTIDVLRNDIDALRAQAQAAAAPIDAQGEPSRYAPDSLEGISELEAQLREARNEIGRLLAEKNDLDNAIEATYPQSIELRAKLKETEEQLQTVRTELEAARYRLASGNGQYAHEPAVTINELESRLRDTMADRQRFHDLSQIHRGDADTLRLEVAELRKKLAEIAQPEGMAALVEAAVEERNAAEAEGQRLTGMIEKQNELVDKLQADVSKAASINRELAQDNDRLIHEHNQMRERLEEAVRRADELELALDDFKLNSDYGKTDAEEDPDAEYDERRSQAINVLADVPELELTYEEMGQMETGMLRYLADLTSGEADKVKEIVGALQFQGVKRWTIDQAATELADAGQCDCEQCTTARVKVAAEEEADKRYPLPASRRAVEGFSKHLAEEVARPSWFAQVQEKQREFFEGQEWTPEQLAAMKGRVVFLNPEGDVYNQLRGNDNPNRGCPIPQAELGELMQGELGAIDAGVIIKTDKPNALLQDKPLPGTWADYDPAKHGANGMEFVDKVRIVEVNPPHCVGVPSVEELQAGAMMASEAEADDEQLQEGEVPTPDGCVRVPVGSQVGGMTAGKNVFVKFDTPLPAGWYRPQAEAPQFEGHPAGIIGSDEHQAAQAAGNERSDAILKHMTGYQDRVSYDLMMEGKAPAPDLGERVASLETQLAMLGPCLDADHNTLLKKIKRLKKRLKKAEARK